MKNKFIVFTFSLIGFLIFQVVLSYVFGMGELFMASFGWAGYGIGLDTKYGGNLISAIMGPLLQGLGLILMSSLFFTISILIYTALQSTKKISHVSMNINRLLLGFSFYFFVSALTMAAYRLGINYATYYMRSGSTSAISTLATVSQLYLLVQFLQLIILILFILFSFKKK